MGKRSFYSHFENAPRAARAFAIDALFRYAKRRRKNSSRGGAGTRSLVSAAGSRTRTLTRTKTSSGTYRRHKAPRRIRKRARRSYKRHLAERAKDLALQTHVGNAPWVVGNPFQGSQMADGYVLLNCGNYSQFGVSEGSDDTALSDNSMCALGGNYGFLPTTTPYVFNYNQGCLEQLFADEGLTKESLIHLETQCMDWYLKNNNSYGIYVELYRITARRDVAAMTGSTTINTPHNCWVHGFVDGLQTQEEMVTQPNFYTPSSMNHFVGTTPFQNPEFCEYWKIWKKTTVYLPPGETLHRQIRKHKRRVLQNEYIRKYAYLKNFTTGFFYLVYSEPLYAKYTDSTTGDEYYAVQTTGAVNCPVVTTWSYNYRLDSEAKNQMFYGGSVVGAQSKSPPLAQLYENIEPIFGMAQTLLGHAGRLPELSTTS